MYLSVCISVCLSDSLPVWPSDFISIIHLFLYLSSTVYPSYIYFSTCRRLYNNPSYIYFSTCRRLYIHHTFISLLVVDCIYITHLFLYLSSTVYPSYIYFSTCLPIQIPICLSVCLPVCVSINMSILWLTKTLNACVSQLSAGLSHCLPTHKQGHAYVPGLPSPAAVEFLRAEERTQSVEL